MSAIPAVSRVRWRPCYRLIPSRFPPISIYDRVADPADLEAIIAIENMTNPSVRQEAGDISQVPPEDRVAGPGTAPIMSVFTHLNPEGSRFSDGSYGVYYAVRTLDTAMAETRHQRERFLGRTNEAPIEVDMRICLAHVDGRIHDIRGRAGLKRIYDPSSYAAGQALGRRIRAMGSYGIVYDSVRRPGGECIGIFRPRALKNCIQGAHYCYVWDGAKITTVYEKKMVAQ
ncbi:MAG: RES domain-containing protein [Betaproteobacteria bacterium]|nr:RES domain-containing protein [Betaproteobacteria bacterium]